MSTAVVLRNVSKSFSNPGSIIAERSSRGNVPAYQSKRGLGDLQLVWAIDDISFSVQQGEIFGICGSKSSGKSTLIRMLAALIHPDAGEMRIYGYDVTRHPRQIQGLSNLVSVEASFYKQLSVMENLLSAARLFGMKRDAANQQAEEILIRLGFSHKERQSPMEELPREKMRMVSIAQALLSRPRLLLMDDKLRGLTTEKKQDVFMLIDELRHCFETTAILTSSCADELSGWCDQVIALEKGKLLDLCAQHESKKRHQETPVRPSFDELVFEKVY